MVQREAEYKDKEDSNEENTLNSLFSRNLELTRELEELNKEYLILRHRLDRIVDNPVWKITKPIRVFLNKAINIFKKIKRCGGPRGLASKLKYKIYLKGIKKSYGTDSYPDICRRKYETDGRFEFEPVISILVPIYNTPIRFLEDMIGSVLEQTYSKWELCLADGSDEEHTNTTRCCINHSKSDTRIKYKKLDRNEGISGNTNECYRMSSGEYIALFDHDDILHPSVLYYYIEEINRSGAEYLYCDEATFVGNSVNNMSTLHFKPDYAIDNLRANNYICHFSCFSRSIIDSDMLLRKEYDGSQDHDMVLRLTGRSKVISHIPHILYYWRSHSGSVASGIEAKTYAIDAAKRAVGDHLIRCGYHNANISSTKAFETIFRIEYEIIDRPLISIIIPNKNHIQDLKRCVDSIITKSSYRNTEIIIVENNSDTEGIRDYYKEIIRENNTNYGIQVKVIEYDGEFNYSAINNYGIANSCGEYIVLLNNDTEVITTNWIEELLMYAQRKDVGCAGAKLLYEDKSIQHAGVILGLGAHRTAGHCHYKECYDNFGYMGRLSYVQNITAVTGACLMINKDKYLEVGGLDESFRVSLNDVDLCLKLREVGYLNIFNPFAELYHYESISRGSDLNGENSVRYDLEAKRFRDKWGKIIEQGDPYFNPNFSLDRSDFSIIANSGLY